MEMRSRLTAPIYALRARAPDGREALGQASVDQDVNQIVLVPGAGIDGTLSGFNAAEVAATDGTWLYSKRVESNRFFLRGMKPGHYTLFAKTDPPGYALQELELEDGVISQVTLTSRPPAVLSGHLLGASGDVLCVASLERGRVQVMRDAIAIREGGAFEAHLPWGRVVIACDRSFRQAVDLVSGEKRQLDLELPLQN